MDSSTNRKRTKSLLDQIVEFQEKILSSNSSSQERDVNNVEEDGNSACTSPTPALTEVMAKRHAFRACRSIGSDRDTPVESCDEDYLASVPSSAQDILENLGFAAKRSPGIPDRFASLPQEELARKLRDKDWHTMDYRILRSLEVCRPYPKTEDGVAEKRPMLRKLQKIQSIDAEDLFSDSTRQSNTLESEPFDKNNSQNSFVTPIGKENSSRRLRHPLVRMATVLSLHGRSTSSDFNATSSSSVEIQNGVLRYQESELRDSNNDLHSSLHPSKSKEICGNSDEKTKEDLNSSKSDLSSDSDENDEDENWFTRQQNIVRKNSEDLLKMADNAHSISKTEKRGQLCRMSTECFIMESDNDEDDDLSNDCRETQRERELTVTDTEELDKEEVAKPEDNHKETSVKSVPCTAPSSFRVKRYPLTKNKTIEISLQSPVREPKSPKEEDHPDLEYQDNEDILQIAIHHIESNSSSDLIDV